MRVMKSLNILCFGDSITAGWSHGGTVYHPYADEMLASLEKSLKISDITADVQGNPGDQVTTPPGGFLTRIDILCKPRPFVCCLYVCIRHPPQEPSQIRPISVEERKIHIP